MIAAADPIDPKKLAYGGAFGSGAVGGVGVVDIIKCFTFFPKNKQKTFTAT